MNRPTANVATRVVVTPVRPLSEKPEFSVQARRALLVENLELREQRRALILTVVVLSMLFLVTLSGWIFAAGLWS
jgi:hypothetical protein